MLQVVNTDIAGMSTSFSSLQTALECSGFQSDWKTAFEDVRLKLKLKLKLK
jgi:hypothetical protein